MSPRLVGLLAFLSASLLASCASYEAMPLRLEHASRNVDNISQDGFIVAAKLRVDRSWQRRHLGRVLTDYDIVPVQLFVQNTNEQDDFVFRVMRDDVEMQLANLDTFEAVPVTDVIAQVTHSQLGTVIWWLLGIFPGYFASSAVSSANEALTGDYRDKAFRDTNVHSGTETVSGMLYYRPQSGSLDGHDLRRSSLKLDVTRSGGGRAGERLSLVVPMNASDL